MTGADHLEGGREGTMEALKGSGTDSPSPDCMEVEEVAESTECRKDDELPPCRRSSCA